MEALERKEIIISLRNQRYTYKKIGNVLGITKQRVEQIFNNKKKPASPITDIPNNWTPSFILKKYSEKNISSRDRLAETVRIRDKQTCQICSKVWEKGKRKFDVHHLDEKRESIKTCENYKKFDEMITLCHKCHLRLRHIRKKIVMHK
jgi:predicted transcriptional regulator